MLKKRIASAIVGIPTILFFLIISPFLWNIFCCLASLLLCREMLNFCPYISKIHRGIVYLCTIILYGLKYSVFIKTESEVTLSLVILLPTTILLLLCSIVEVLQKSFLKTIERISWPLFCFIYASLFLSFMVDLRFLDLSSVSNNSPIEKLPIQGIWYVIYIFVGSWMCDTGALLLGKYYGKKPLGIQCSPSKTWIGLLGGSFFSLLGMILLRSFVISKEKQYVEGGFFDPVYTIFFLCICICICILSVLGDLIESAIKRSQFQKDSGTFFPGHGGIFDVIDSCIPTCVFFYIAMQVWQIYK